MSEFNEARTNWAGNLTYSAKEYYQPSSIEELQSMIKSADKVRTLGTRHCFNRIADSKFSQISVRSLDHLMEVDKDKNASYHQCGCQLWSDM